MFTPSAIRIYNAASRTLILHVEDNLSQLNRIALEIWQFQQGNGASKHIRTWITTSDARLIAHRIITGTLTKWTKYTGGVSKAGEITARVTTLEWATTDRSNTGLRITLSSGPGTLTPTRAVKPAGKLESLTFFLNEDQSLTMALSIRDAILTWEIWSYSDRREKLWRPN